MDYRVDLPIFHGPLDLLLFLIRRDELDITDIPIGHITQSYLDYLQELRNASREHGFDINIAGDFLVMAATLMEIKSQMLLPPPEKTERAGAEQTAESLGDPRYELVQQLLEYKRLKDNAGLLEQRAADHAARFARVPARLEGEADEPPPLDLDEVQIWDLLDAFTAIMKDIGHRGPVQHEVTYDETPIDLHATDIEDRVKREKGVTLRKLLETRTSKSEMIGVFLALLELVREKRVLVEYDENHELQITEAPEEHKKTFHGGSLELTKTEHHLPGE